MLPAHSVLESLDTRFSSDSSSPVAIPSLAEAKPGTAASCPGKAMPTEFPTVGYQENTLRPWLVPVDAKANTLPALSPSSSIASVPTSLAGPQRCFSAMSGPVDFDPLRNTLIGDVHDFSLSNPDLPHSQSGSESLARTRPTVSLAHTVASSGLITADEDDDESSPLIHLAFRPGLSRAKKLQRSSSMRAAVSLASANADALIDNDVNEAAGVSLPRVTALAAEHVAARPHARSSDLTNLSSVFASAAIPALSDLVIPCSSSKELPLVIIFHCEYSQSRGPDMLRAVRAFDRRVHLHDYPALSFPHLYVLDRGYRQLRELEPDLCVPYAGAFVAMEDPRHHAALDACSKERKNGMKHFRALRPGVERGLPTHSEPSASPSAAVTKRA